MASVTVVFDSAAVRALANSPSVRAGMDRLAAVAVQTMKRRAPVSPVGSEHRSGQLRSSIRAVRQPNGDIHINPTISYTKFVNDKTRPHIIRSKGPWPLRNRETGQVFGRVVHHPGTRANPFIQRTAEDLNGMRIQL